MFELELKQPRPDTRVVGHLTGRKRLANLLEVEALAHAARGERTAAAEEMNGLLALDRQTGPGRLQPTQVLEKLLALPGWTDPELETLSLRDTVALKTRLQLTLVAAEIRDLESLLWMSSAPFTRPGESIPVLARLGMGLLGQGRSLVDVLTLHPLIERSRASYDELWSALYAPSESRFQRLSALAVRQRTAGGALIYSVGPDLKDDQGRAIPDAEVLEPHAAGDVVFHLPTAG